ncbi:hypothetical protein BDZ91DRAFT_745697 [Kalaharituber pfeilii]|nr:hypothetical protein BDZ91DRAFT_745697 [Kalaharituber pfeilii]
MFVSNRSSRGPLDLAVQPQANGRLESSHHNPRDHGREGKPLVGATKPQHSPSLVGFPFG